MSNGLKTSLGIWALGPMVTRFVPGGYKPEFAGESTADRVRRAVEGLGDLIDGYEFHYPQELNEENLEAVLGGHDVYCMATGLHLDPRFSRGGLVSPDPATRAEAVKRTLAAIDFSGGLGAHFIIWPGIEGYNYPFQTPYKESWEWLVDGIGRLRLSLLGIPLRTSTGPETNVGEAMRYLSELPWAPHAISANRDLFWRAVNARTVEVSMSLGGSTAAVALSFDDAGDIVRATGTRPFQVGRAFVPTPWGGDFSNYESFNGIRIPTYGEAWWELSEGRFVYWAGHITALQLVKAV